MKPLSRMPAPQTSMKQPAEFTPLVQDEIRRRAYELYEQRGREGGRDLEDWLRAESELRQKAAKTVAA